VGFNPKHTMQQSLGLTDPDKSCRPEYLTPLYTIAVTIRLPTTALDLQQQQDFRLHGVVIKITAFWDVTLCREERRFRWKLQPLFSE
jgi:hypothetical protein